MQCALLDPNAHIPTQATPGSAGWDLYSLCDTIVPANSSQAIPTGVAVKFPDGYYGMVVPRSGLMFKHGVFAGTGIIDMDYRGSIYVMLFNTTKVDFVIKKHDRIAQVVVQQTLMGKCVNIPLNDWIFMCQCEAGNQRGTNGFGSSGGMTEQSK